MPLTSSDHPGPAPSSRGVHATVLGVGQMGLVCAGILARGEARAEAGGPVESVRLWGHDEQETLALAQARVSPRLPGYRLPDRVRVVADAREALRGADLVVSAIPVQFIRATWTGLAQGLEDGAGVLSVAKGVEIATGLTPTGIVREVLLGTGSRPGGAPGRDDPDGPARRLAVLSGPTVAEELARRLPAAMVAASDDPDFALHIQSLFTTGWLRVYTLGDVLGVELAGATKNVIALAAGVLDGLGAGYNAKAALMARGLAEITRLGVAMGAAAETFFGIAGVGDLATSCFSPGGRNRTLGEALGRGEPLAAGLARMPHVVEGVPTTRAILALAKRYRVEMPITHAVGRVLFEGVDPIDAIGSLMSREVKPERVG